MATRVERDPLGELDVPADAYYGVQTQRAVDNFPISGLKAPAPLVTATVLIKQACARANGSLGRLDASVADAIARAADEILGGALRDQFIVDVYQAGAGTSHNMNTNEVLANRAGEMLGEAKGTYTRVHPLDHASSCLHELNLGATAVGTGLNAGDDFTQASVMNLVRASGLPLKAARNRFRVTQSMGDVLTYSGGLRRLAVEVDKAASDLRLLSSGPRAGIAELLLPAVQPGSSIMPGKVNPSVPEMVNQVCQQVWGCDQTILAACAAGQLELNVMMPVIAWNALHASTILGNAMKVLTDRCVTGIQADEARCRELLDRSTAVATALSPYIGYAATADIAKTAVKTGRSIAEIVRERGLVTGDQLDAILSPEAMTSPGIPGADRKES